MPRMLRRISHMRDDRHNIAVYNIATCSSRAPSSVASGPGGRAVHCGDGPDHWRPGSSVMANRVGEGRRSESPCVPPNGRPFCREVIDANYWLSIERAEIYRTKLGNRTRLRLARAPHSGLRDSGSRCARVCSMTRFLCPSCASPAIAAPSKIEDRSPIRCKRCGAALGTWGELKERALRVALAGGQGLGVSSDPLQPR
ncbi:hypothetical protein SAMN05519103_04961 [Rhizobiales bacterium GAS113]|jgi:hypothetical protein|nr:hypothetical protein SAMN05519103_04961 [Rhizobiales bacterium GAS113]SEE12895.1 hypothetical protein SAMN05519104_5279 [Rhizobiales bacterium GAS188]